MLIKLNIITTDEDRMWRKKLFHNPNYEVVKEIEEGIYECIHFGIELYLKRDNKKVIKDFYGISDNYTQILEKYKDLLDDPNKKYIISITKVTRKEQPKREGWRWHKWGPYIGTQNPTHEYLYDDKHIKQVYCYHIYEIGE